MRSEQYGLPELHRRATDSEQSLRRAEAGMADIADQVDPVAQRDRQTGATLAKVVGFTAGNKGLLVKRVGGDGVVSGGAFTVFAASRSGTPGELGELDLSLAVPPITVGDWLYIVLADTPASRAAKRRVWVTEEVFYPIGC